MSIATDLAILFTVWGAVALILIGAAVRQWVQCRRYEKHVDQALRAADPRPTLRVIGGQR